MEQISEKLRELEGKWVALDKVTGEVIESAETLRELNQKISQSPLRVTLFKVPRLDVNLVPLGA